jgi:hypothetical protein
MLAAFVVLALGITPEPDAETSHAEKR